MCHCCTGGLLVALAPQHLYASLCNDEDDSSIEEDRRKVIDAGLCGEVVRYIKEFSMYFWHSVGLLFALVLCRFVCTHTEE